MFTLEITVSNLTLESDFGVNTDGFGVEGQIDQLLFYALQDEFGDDFDVSATSGSFDSLSLWRNSDGERIDPAKENVPVRVAKTLGAIDWSEIDYSLDGIEPRKGCRPVFLQARETTGTKTICGPTGESS